MQYPVREDRAVAAVALRQEGFCTAPPKWLHRSTAPARALELSTSSPRAVRITRPIHPKRRETHFWFFVRCPLLPEGARPPIC
jgi:hypothetical protein